MVQPIPAFKDNYFWLLRYAGQALVVDPGDAEPVLEVLDSLQEPLIGILLTHHHSDHIGGVEALCKRWPAAVVYGPADPRIEVHQLAQPGCRLQIGPKMGPEFGPELVGDWPSFEVLDLTGHTRSHIGYYADGQLFCGDTLFSLGCGRLFEGTAAEMWRSLQRIAALPDETLVYCAHEYTAANLRFAQAVFPGDPELLAFAQQLSLWRSQGTPSIPTPLARELRLNPFLRMAQAHWRARLGAIPALLLADPDWNAERAFAALRRLKDEFV